MGMVVTPYLVVWPELARRWRKHGPNTDFVWEEINRKCWDPPPIFSGAVPDLRVSDTVANLAKSIFEAKDFDRLAVLADALEESGMTEAAVLNHCRHPIEHREQCWVVDIILGKDWFEEYRPTCWISYHGAEHKFSEMYEVLRPRMLPGQRNRFDRFFQAYFWWNEEGGVYRALHEMDLTGEYGDGTFAISMKPATVRKYVRMAESLCFDDLRAHFAAIDWGYEQVLVRGKTEDRPICFDPFHEYVMQWIDLIRYADRRGRGIVVTIV